MLEVHGSSLNRAEEIQPLVVKSGRVHSCLDMAAEGNRKGLGSCVYSCMCVYVMLSI